jgi:hypothetical protein
MSDEKDISAADLGAVAVTDEAGRERPLGLAWAERTAVLVFIRHFG